MSTSIEDNELPKAIMTRIMKQVLPENTNIQANAKLAMAKSTTLFINYLASEANEMATGAGHKIVTGTHVMKAIEALALEDMLPRLQEEYKAFQDIQRSRKQSAAKPVKDVDEDSPMPGSKKRKPTDKDFGSNAKARKSAANTAPRSTQDLGERAGDAEKEEDVGDDADEELEDDDEGLDDDDLEETTEDNKVSLNMNEPDLDRTHNLDDDEDDSDGF